MARAVRQQLPRGQQEAGRRVRVLGRLEIDQQRRLGPGDEVVQPSLRPVEPLEQPLAECQELGLAAVPPSVAAIVGGEIGQLAQARIGQHPALRRAAVEAKQVGARKAEGDAHQ